MTAICSLFSGSSGNCIYVEGNNTKILVDAGVSGKRIFEALGRIDRSADEIDGIFVTHEHRDHIASVGIVCRKFKIPIYATEGTWIEMKDSLGKIDDSLIKLINTEEKFMVGNLGVKAFEIPHDAAAPVGFSFYSGNSKATVATDIGEMSDLLFLSLSGSDVILLESNHDINMLENGNYPYHLKRRIRGKLGHLSNDEAAATCARLVSLGTHKIILGHLSGENNLPQLAYKTAVEIIERSGAKIGRDVLLEVAPRHTEGRLIVA